MEQKVHVGRQQVKCPIQRKQRKTGDKSKTHDKEAVSVLGTFLGVQPSAMDHMVRPSTAMLFPSLYMAYTLF